jgi:hypothetical protein
MGVVTKEEFLNRLLDFGLKNKYFEYQLIKDPEDTCCSDVEIEVIDYDKTKAKIEEFSLKESSFNVTKSCDALKIMPNEGRIDFIEYKRWQAFIDNELQSIHTGNDRRERIVEKINKFDFGSKIHDSLFLLTFFTKNRQFKLTKEEKRLLSQIPINYIILIDINLQENPLDFIAAAFTVLGTSSSNIDSEVSNEIKKELDSIDIGSQWNIQRPMHKNCESIVTFYN